jgi:hypothetical protein
VEEEDTANQGKTNEGNMQIEQNAEPCRILETSVFWSLAKLHTHWHAHIYHCAGRGDGGAYQVCRISCKNTVQS